MIDVQQAILEACLHIEKSNNNGSYASFFPPSCRAILKPKYKVWRDGILYYSRGHGWRVRRNPDWRVVYEQRFDRKPEA